MDCSSIMDTWLCSNGSSIMLVLYNNVNCFGKLCYNLYDASSFNGDNECDYMCF